MFHFRKTIDSTSGSMVPRLVPEISPLDAFCDGRVVVVVVVVGIGDSRSWIHQFVIIISIVSGW